MRTTLSAVTALAMILACGPVRALEASDTMAAWRNASPEAKTKVVADLFKQEGRQDSTAPVVTCMDAAAAITGHADLPIRQVAEACAKADGEPV